MRAPDSVLALLEVIVMVPHGIYPLPRMWCALHEQEDQSISSGRRLSISHCPPAPPRGWSGSCHSRGSLMLSESLSLSELIRRGLDPLQGDDESQ